MNTFIELGIFSLVTLHMKYYVDYYLNFSLVLDLKFYALREQGRKGWGEGGEERKKGVRRERKEKWQIRQEQNLNFYCIDSTASLLVFFFLLPVYSLQHYPLTLACLDRLDVIYVVFFIIQFSCSFKTTLTIFLH